MTPVSNRGITPELERRVNASYFGVQRPCEEALSKLCDDYNVLADRVEEAWAALAWIADHYPKAMREMPTALYQPLRRHSGL